MKKQLLYLLSLLLILLLHSCKDEERIFMPNVTGAASEVTIVMNKYLWEGELGKELKAIFEQAQPGLIREEPMFDIRRIAPDAFSDIYQRKRNLVIIRIADRFKEATLKTQKEVWAKYQLVVYIDAPNEELAIEKLKTDGDLLIDRILSEERRRSNISSKSTLNKEIMKTLESKYQIKLNIPAGIRLYAEHDDFVWLGKEKTDLKQHLCIYYYDYLDTSAFNIENLIATRNKFMKKYIEGAKKGSYMTTELMLPPVLKEFYFQPAGKVDKDIYIAELRGLWKMENGDFMGGSFVSLSTVDTKRNRIVTIEGYVYNPNKKHRNLLRYLEAIMYSFDFVE